MNRKELFQILSAKETHWKDFIKYLEQCLAWSTDSEEAEIYRIMKGRCMRHKGHLRDTGHALTVNPVEDIREMLDLQKNWTRDQMDGRDMPELNNEQNRRLWETMIDKTKEAYEDLLDIEEKLEL